MHAKHAVFDEAQLRERLADFLQAQTKRRWTLGAFTRYASGFSWITLGVAAREEGSGGGRGLILRLGPAYGLFAPYSAMPQYAALKALEDSSVPVPKAYWWSDDATILGAPFFVSERVEGAAPVPWMGRNGTGFEEGYRRSVGTQFVEALADLHKCRWNGKSGFELNDTTCDNAASRQVEFWEQGQSRWALKPYPMLTWAFRWLRKNLPTAPRVSLVHGDYRLGNFLEKDGRITAILDWELVHLGDPHEDLGWAFLPQYSGGSGLVCRLLPKDEFIALYERAAGFKVRPESLHFYLIFSLVKLALTHIAAVRCFEEGRFNDLRMPAMGTQVAPVLRQISKLLP
jgi:aminoglycoside phosphotransferase (APT) family kinase protein